MMWARTVQRLQACLWLRHGTYRDIPEVRPAPALALTGRPWSKRSSLSPSFSRKQPEGRYLETPEFFVPEFSIFLSTVFRERYLRNDVSCGIQGCQECEPETSSASPMVGEWHPSFLDDHFVLPNSNVFFSPSKLAENDYAFPNTDQL